MHRVSWQALVLAMVWSGASGVASAQTRSPAELRSLLTEGQEAYQQQRYRRAQEAFSAVFAQTGNPELLYNLALCHRGMGEPGEAARYLRRFLVARPQHPERAAIERTLAELEASAQALAPTPAAPAPAAPPPPPLERATALDSPARTVAPAPTPAASSPTPWLRWTLLGTGVVAAGVGTGMILSARGRVDGAGSAANEQAYLDELDAASSLRGAGAVVLGVGVAALGVGLARWLFVRPAGTVPSRRASLSLGAGPGALMLFGRW
jgi:tetratricopeptide (TPR) repeat protein